MNLWHEEAHHHGQSGFKGVEHQSALLKKLSLLLMVLSEGKRENPALQGISAGFVTSWGSRLFCKTTGECYGEAVWEHDRKEVHSSALNCWLQTISEIEKIWWRGNQIFHFKFQFSIEGNFKKCSHCYLIWNCFWKYQSKTEMKSGKNPKSTLFLPWINKKMMW